MTYKFKDMRTTDDSSGTWLWYIGADSSNGVLIGPEDSDRRIRIYNRSGGNNTVIGTENYVFTKQQWTDAEITLNNGTITISVGGKSLSHSLSSRTVFETWGSNYTNCRIAEWKLKPL